MLDQVQAYIDEHGLLEAGQRVGVGVSGGLDSTVLLHLLAEAGYQVTGLHVNYELRGDASDEDERFARALCDRLDAPCRVVRCNPTDSEGASRQAVARRQRYAFFADVAERDDLSVVAVAHHRDDQAETVLLNLFRGSGPEGLAGMPPARPLEKRTGVSRPHAQTRLARPLLFAAKDELRAYAETHDLRWQRDASNDDPAYRRNALRREVLPVVCEHFGEAAPRKIAEAAKLMRAYLDDAWQPQLDEHFAACANDERRQLNLDALRALAPVWRRRVILEALRRWLPGAPRRASTASAVTDLLDAQPGRRVSWPSGTVWREREALRFVADAESNQPQSGWLALDETLTLAMGKLRAEAISERPADLSGERVAYLDRDRLSFPLRARPWRDGDRFRPLGMSGTKTVGDLLTDAQVPPSEREGVLVLCSEDEIVWVVGHRLAEHARLQSDTRRHVKITYIPDETA
jgi:tRNA(Ile)-lysidine synthase